MLVERILSCPACGGGLRASRFARSVDCPFCGNQVHLDPSVVSAARYREALATWKAPPEGTDLLAGDGWEIGPRIALGESSDLHPARRARAPTEQVLVKLLREPEHAGLLAREAATLAGLDRVDGRGAAIVGARTPRLVTHGVIEAGPHRGRRALVLRATPGFRVTLGARVRAGAIPAVASVWVWRRTLEALAALHRAGLGHGAILPPHLLLEDGEHGVQLLGFSAAGPLGSRLPFRNRAWGPVYGGATVLTPALDVAMSARTIAWAVGGDPATAEAPVPEAYAEVLRDAAAGRHPDAWTLREWLASVARTAFGPPSFHPLVPLT